ncbi:MAG: DUF4332 domain-containing protein, partial [Candidatus Thorarchaeota archaeon]|nr:DUF4332 domain-containing protein [Candidatus Thorarchaeota archaeon]
IKRTQNRQVEELVKTGTVDKTLTHDVVGKSEFFVDLEAKGLLRFREQKATALVPGTTESLKYVVLPPEAPPPKVRITAVSGRSKQRKKTAARALTPAPVVEPPVTVRESELETSAGVSAEKEAEAAGPVAQPVPVPEPVPVSEPTVEGRLEERGREAEKQRRPHLTLDDPVQEAPGIGSRTAAALARIGIKTVRDLVSRPAAEVAQKLADKRIDDKRVRAWQHESKLMCEVPALYGHDAVILYNVGIGSRSQLVEADPTRLLKDAVAYASSEEAQKEMRSVPVPDKSEVLRWIESAKAAVAYLPEVQVS